MKKLKTSLIALTKISLICLAFFVFTPSLKAHAMFSDTVSINMGIQLELGTVSIVAKDTTIIDAVSFTEGDPVLVASSTLINDGSLSGKLAYKIDVTNEDGIMLEPEEEKDMSVIINIKFGDVANEASLNTKSFTFAKDSSSNDIIIEPDEIGNVPVKVEYKSSVPTEKEKLKIIVTFRLIQSNAADANAEMFSDEESLTNTVTLVPKVIEEKSYWPDASTFKNSNNKKFTYSLEKMNMLYSGTYGSLGSENRKIKNLNKAYLYIQIPGNEPLASTFKISHQLSSENNAIVEESREFNEEHHGIVITFKLNDSYSYKNPHAKSYSLGMRIILEKYGMYSPEYVDDSYIAIPFFAKQLVLSSDIPSEKDEWDFEHKEIQLSTTLRSINIKQLEGTSHWVSKNQFKDVQFTNEIVELEVTGDKPGHVEPPLFSKNQLLLKLNTSSNANIKGAALNVKILGDAGNMLVISRTLKNGNSDPTDEVTIQSKSRSLMNVPMTVEEIEEPTEQAIDSEKSVEVPDSSIDKTTPDEQAIKSSVEESDTEQVTDESEVVEETKEAVDSSSVDSAAESIEESDQTIPVEAINNE